MTTDQKQFYFEQGMHAYSSYATPACPYSGEAAECWHAGWEQSQINDFDVDPFFFVEL